MENKIKRIAVLISGGGTNLQALIDAQQRGELSGEIVLVISNRKAAYGLERARLAGIDTMSISKFDHPHDEDFDEVILKELQKREVDFIVLAGYLRILTPKLIRAFENRILNIHPSLIPSFCGDGFYGMKVHESVIAKGVKYSGATVHLVDEDVDTGLIIEQGICRVKQDDTPESLAKRVLEIEHEILVKSVRAFCEGNIEITNHRAYIRE